MNHDGTETLADRAPELAKVRHCAVHGALGHCARCTKRHVREEVRYRYGQQHELRPEYAERRVRAEYLLALLAESPSVRLDQQAVAEAGIVVDMIVQNLVETGRAELSFSVPEADVDRALAVTRELVTGLDPRTRVVADPSIAKVIVVGVGMRTHTGVARRMFGALAARGINIAMINTS